MTRKDRSKDLTAAVLAASAPSLVMMSCDDNLVFEHENVGRMWLAAQGPWSSNDNARRPADLVTRIAAL